MGLKAPDFLRIPPEVVQFCRTGTAWLVRSPYHIPCSAWSCQFGLIA